jgi:hypothetical protein
MLFLDYRAAQATVKPPKSKPARRDLAALRPRVPGEARYLVA